LKVKAEDGMGDSKIEGFMKKHPPWFMFDFHPIRFARKLSEEEQKNEQETDVDRRKE